MTIDALSSAATKATAAAKPAGQDLKTAAKQFEAIFLRQMIGAMRSSSMGEDILGSEASNQFRDMSDSRLADSMAGSGALGIADLLMRQFGATKAPGVTTDKTKADQ